MQKKFVSNLESNIIQIAGVIDQKEADDLISCGATLLGFQLRLPVNAEDLTESEAKAIIENLRKGVDAVLITYQNSADDILNFCQEMGAQFIQLHGEISKKEIQCYTRRHRPGTGNLMVYHRVFKIVGAFDESFTEGGEDHDFYLRIRAAGIDAWHTTDAVVWHIDRRSTRR